MNIYTSRDSFPCEERIFMDGKSVYVASDGKIYSERSKILHEHVKRQELEKRAKENQEAQN